MVLWFFDHPGNHGIFNIGTGRAATWNEITECVFRAMGREPRIEYVDMPGDLKGRYQYYTCASVDKLKSVCPVEPGTLEDGVRDYVQGHLEPGAIW
jgi:ADP-L-glycero-D-manno-heptose 6-epimerase